MSFKSVLQKYIKNPEQHPDLVVYHDAKAVILRDAFPKSEVHYLVMPRSASKSRQSPMLAFKDLGFRNEMEFYVELARQKALEEFGAKFETVGDVKVEEFVRCGCHAVPSLSNLHIHVITRDFHSTRLKNKRHYNSFNTDFFVDLDELPLPSDKTKFEEPRFDSKKMESLVKRADQICSYCGENFGSKFQQLKDHLETEFAAHFKAK